MAEYDELVDMLKFLIGRQLQPAFRFTRGLLGDGQGTVDIEARPGFSFVRPDRSTANVFEMFNKLANGPDGTPILIGELPWQPGLQQVLGIDWETYLTVGWDSRFAGQGRHGEDHEWRDGQVGVDVFNVYRRSIVPLRTDPASGTSVRVNPYDYYSDSGSRVSWPGSPTIDLDAAIPVNTGTQRFALVYWNYASQHPYGKLSVATGTTVVFAPTVTPPRPVHPPGAIPSAFVKLRGGQTKITELDIYDARPLWADDAPTKLYTPDRGLAAVSVDGQGRVFVGGGDLIITSGNLGVGITPTENLHIYDTATATTLLVENSTGNVADLELKTTGEHWRLRANDVTNVFTINDVGGATAPFKIEQAAPTDSLVIDVTGQVGVGLTAPTAQLHVVQGIDNALIPVLLLDQTDLSEEFIQLNTTVGAGNPVDTAALGAYYGTARVSVNGTFKKIALYDV